jgi:hypothetical protein
MMSRTIKDTARLRMASDGLLFRLGSFFALGPEETLQQEHETNEIRRYDGSPKAKIPPFNRDPYEGLLTWLEKLALARRWR